MASIEEYRLMQRRIKNLYEEMFGLRPIYTLGGVITHDTEAFLHTQIEKFARLSELDNWWCCHFGYVGVLCYLLPLCMLFGTIPKASTKMIN